MSACVPVTARYGSPTCSLQNKTQPYKAVGVQPLNKKQVFPNYISLQSKNLQGVFPWRFFDFLMIAESLHELASHFNLLVVGGSGNVEARGKMRNIQLTLAMVDLHHLLVNHAAIIGIDIDLCPLGILALDGDIRFCIVDACAVG